MYIIIYYMPIHSVIKAPAFLISKKIIFHPSDMRNVYRQKNKLLPRK